MSRTPVSLRQAVAADVPFLVELWTEALRRADAQEQAADVELLVKEAAKSAEQRLLVAERDGHLAGAVLLQVTTLSALDLDPAVKAVAPCVAPSFRRQGVGGALMDAAVTWAEELGVAHVMTGVTASSRHGNRFMARLSLRPQATLRSAPTPLVRAKLTAMLPAMVPASQRVPRRAGGRRQLGQVLAARRQLRRTPLDGTDG